MQNVGVAELTSVVFGAQNPTGGMPKEIVNGFVVCIRIYICTVQKCESYRLSFFSFIHQKLSVFDL